MNLISRISTEKNIKMGIVLSYLTLLINVIISIIYTPFLLAHIGQSQYGLTSFVTSITSWFTVLSSALVSSYIRFATRESAKTNDQSARTVNSAYFIIFSAISFFIMIFGTILFFVMKYAILPNSIYAENHDSIHIILILTIISLLSIVISVPGNLFGLYNNWKQKFVVTKGIALLVNILQPICTIPFLLLGCDVIVVSIIQLVFTVIGIVLHLISSVKLFGFGFSKSLKLINKSLLKEILIFSSFIILNSLVDQINSSADKTILGFMVKDDAHSVAIYQAGMIFKNYLLMLSVSISSAFSTKINGAVVDNNTDRVNAIFRKVSKIQIILILFIIGGFATFGQSFVDLWLGEDYSMSFYVALILFVLSSIPYTENVSIEVQRAMNKHKFRAILYVCIALTNIALTIILVAVLDKSLAIWACLIGTAFAIIIGHWIIINVYNAKVIKLDIKGYFFDLLKTLIAVCVCFGLTKGALLISNVTDNVISLFSSLIIYVSLYFAYSLLFERKFISSFFKKGAIEQL